MEELIMWYRTVNAMKLSKGSKFNRKAALSLWFLTRDGEFKNSPIKKYVDGIECANDAYKVYNSNPDLYLRVIKEGIDLFYARKANS